MPESPRARKIDADLLVVRLEFAERTISDLDEVETRALPAGRRGGIDPVTLDPTSY